MKTKLFFVFIIFLVFSINVRAHDNKEVHPKITFRALTNDLIDEITYKYEDLLIYKGADNYTGGFTGKNQFARGHLEKMTSSRREYELLHIFIIIHQNLTGKEKGYIR